MNQVKSPSELKKMREGGKKLGAIRDQLLEKIAPGVTPLEIEKLAQLLIRKAGGTPSFMIVNGYKWATCISVNDGVVHGIPTKVPFSSGDVVGIDVGLLYQGLHTDTSWTILVQNQNSHPKDGQPLAEKLKNQNEIEKFVKSGEIALKKAIDQAKPGNRVGHISQAIAETVEGAGYSVVRSLVGHGVGRVLHEPPQIPGILTQSIEKTPPLLPGMVIAIEVIYNMGRPEITYKNTDGWSLVTADGSLSGLFEHTVAITAEGPIVLT